METASVVAVCRVHQLLPDTSNVGVTAIDKRPAEELYLLASDPHQLRNVAADPAHAAILGRLRGELEAWMRTSADPRADNDDDRWDRYPYFVGPAK